MVKNDSSVQRQIARNVCCTKPMTLRTESKSLESQTNQSDTSNTKDLDALKELDKMTGYANCTGNNITGDGFICECAEDSENATNDVLEILVASTQPPEVRVERIEENAEGSENIGGQLEDIYKGGFPDQVTQEGSGGYQSCSEDVKYHEGCGRKILDHSELMHDDQEECQVDDTGEYGGEELKKRSEKDTAVWLGEKISP